MQDFDYKFNDTCILQSKQSCYFPDITELCCQRKLQYQMITQTKKHLSLSSLVFEIEAASSVNNPEANTEQLVQNLVICNAKVHTESTTAHQISKDTDVPTHGTDVPSHGTEIFFTRQED